MSTILYSKPFITNTKATLKAMSNTFRLNHGFQPGLAVIIIGDDKASLSYTGRIEKTAKSVDINFTLFNLAADTGQNDVNALVDRLNRDDRFHGIIVQAPLPKQISWNEIRSRLSPHKDVDGITPFNAGLLALGERSGFAPCTALATIRLLKEYRKDLQGLDAAIVGRSNIVGKPLYHLLLMENITVTTCHSKTRNLKRILSESDIVVAAMGKAKFITSDMLSDKSIVLDVGINFQDGKLCGDVDFENVKDRVEAISPVPGGIGPMTNIILMENVARAAETLAGK